MLIEITPHFLECVRNTYNDLTEQGNISEETEALRDIITNNRITVVSATAIYTLIAVRKANIKYVKKHQDRATFKIINKEHKYMNDFLDRFFINGLTYANNHLLGYVSISEVA
jgi:hypothetical protein